MSHHKIVKIHEAKRVQDRVQWRALVSREVKFRFHEGREFGVQVCNCSVPIMCEVWREESPLTSAITRHVLRSSQGNNEHLSRRVNIPLAYPLRLHCTLSLRQQFSVTSPSGEGDLFIPQPFFVVVNVIFFNKISVCSIYN